MSTATPARARLESDFDGSGWPPAVGLQALTGEIQATRLAIQFGLAPAGAMTNLSLIFGLSHLPKLSRPWLVRQSKAFDGRCERRQASLLNGYEVKALGLDQSAGNFVAHTIKL